MKKGFGFLPLVIVLLSIPVLVVSGNYIGPNRPRPSVHDPSGDYVVLSHTSGPGSVSSCTINTGAAGGDCNTTPSPEQQEYWCNSGTLYAAGYCGSHPGKCWGGDIVERHCNYSGGGNYDPATVGASLSCTGGGGFCRTASVTFSARETMSGKVITYIEGDPGVLCDPADGTNVSCVWNVPATDANYNFNYWAHSSQGDTSYYSNLQVNMDVTPPTWTGSFPAADGSNGWYRNSASGMSLSATDSRSGAGAIQYSVDGGAWAAGSVTLADGTHTVTARVSDNAGNAAANYGPVAFNVDKTAPVVQASSACTTWCNSPFSANVDSASDATSGIDASSYTYSVDGGASQSGSSVSISSDGSHTVTFNVLDMAGNPASASKTYYLDTVPPTAAASVPASTGTSGWFSTSPVTVTNNSSDATSGVNLGTLEMQVDGGAYNTAQSVAVAGDGIHSISMNVDDVAGNSTDGAVVATVQIDTAAPSLTPSVPAAGASGWYTSEPTISVSGTDATSGMQSALARVDGGAWQVNSVSVSGDGVHTVDLRTVDVAGNYSTASQTIRVDTVAPVSAFSAPAEGSNVTSLGTVSISGSSSDATSGLASVEISLNGGGTWQTLSVSGGSWTYSWDTTGLSNGTYTALVRARDVAGNVGPTTNISVNVNNDPPAVSLSKSWEINNSGSLSVVPNSLFPLQSVTLRIIGTGGHPDRVVDLGTTPPAEYHWDGKFGDGAWASYGNYQVVLTATDIWGRVGVAYGTITSPEPTPTSFFYFLARPSATATPTQTMTPTPTATGTLAPTGTAAAPAVIVETPAPTIVITPTPAPEPIRIPWYFLAVLGLCLACGVSAAADPRPKRLMELRGTLRGIINLDK